MKLGIVCRVQKYAFLSEWRRRIRDFIAQDFKPQDWETSDWRLYAEHDFRYPRWADLRRLNLRRLDDWLERHRPRTIRCPQVLVSGAGRAADWARDWAGRQGCLLEAKGYQPEEVHNLQKDRIELHSIPVVNRRLHIKHDIRDCQAVLLLSASGELVRDDRIAMLYAQRLDRPCLHLHAGMASWRHRLEAWCGERAIERLNLVICGSADAEVPPGFVQEVCGQLECLDADVD